MLEVLDATLVSSATIALVFEVILAVLDPIFVSSAFSAAVALSISAARSAAVEVIEVVLLAVFADILASKAVMLIVLDVTLVSSAFSAFVALVISAVMLEVLEDIVFVLLVMLAVFELTLFVKTNSAA